MTTSQKADLGADVAAIQRIPIINELLDVICRVTGMGFAAVARVTQERWVACATKDNVNFGLGPGGELPVESTLCNEIFEHGKVIVFDNVAEDEQYRNHHTPRIYGLKSYISVPLVLRNGEFFGTLCAIHPEPARLNNVETIGMFRLYAELIAFHLDVNDRLAAAESSLQDERKTAELRDQFIAILGHDLRNPVSAVNNVAQMMMRMSTEERYTRLAKILQDASFRMRELIENVLDFARGKLGDGITLQRTREDHTAVLQQVITELQLTHPRREINANLRLHDFPDLDGKRIAQVLSNLLSNAITHGTHDKPVTIDAALSEAAFTLKVSNQGEPILPVVMQNLFSPFVRGSVKPGQQGLGLGLYVAHEIATAHGGTLTVTSNTEATCFTLTIPQGTDPCGSDKNAKPDAQH